MCSPFERGLVDLGSVNVGTEQGGRDETSKGVEELRALARLDA